MQNVQRKRLWGRQFCRGIKTTEAALSQLFHFVHIQIAAALSYSGSVIPDSSFSNCPENVSSTDEIDAWEHTSLILYSTKLQCFKRIMLAQAVGNVPEQRSITSYLGFEYLLTMSFIDATLIYSGRPGWLLTNPPSFSINTFSCSGEWLMWLIFFITFFHHGCVVFPSSFLLQLSCPSTDSHQAPDRHKRIACTTTCIW